MYLQGSGAAAIQITEAAEWTLEVDFDTVPDPAFGDTWETKLKGLLRFSGSLAGNFDTAQSGNAVWEAVIATTSRKLYLYPDASTTGRYYYGNIWPKLSVDMSVTSKGSFSGAFEGDGQLGLQ